MYISAHLCVNIWANKCMFSKTLLSEDFHNSRKYETEELQTLNNTSCVTGVDGEIGFKALNSCMRRIRNEAPLAEVGPSSQGRVNGGVDTCMWTKGLFLSPSLTHRSPLRQR